MLAPLHDALRQYVMNPGKLHADDTPVPVLAPGTGKTKLGRLWTYVRDDRPAGDLAAPAVWFAYSPDRKGEHPHRHLATFAARCKPMAMRASTVYMRAAAFEKRRAGRMFVASSLICTRHMLLLSPTKRWSASGGCMRLRAKSVVGRRRNGSKYGTTRARPLLIALHEWFKTTLDAGLPQIRSCGGDRLRARALAGACALLR